MNVLKRNNILELIDLAKIHKILEWATEGLTNVSISAIEINAQLQFTEGISTSDIQKILIKSASDLISLRNPNYQYVSSRLLLMELRKEVYGSYEPSGFVESIKKNITNGHYENIFGYFTEDEVAHLGSKIKYDRDLTFTYSGLRTVVDKFLVQDRVNHQVFETPQEMFILIPMIMFKDEPSDRLTTIVEYYNLLSTFTISLPSPIMAGMRTKSKMYSSCALIDSGDTTKSLIAANGAVVALTAAKAGIGLNFSSVRSLGASVANGSVLHTGVTPILKWFEGAIKSMTQKNRGGSATTYFHWWNYEIFKVLTLKSNKSTDENSVRKLDYGVGLNKLIFARAQDDTPVTLFCAKDSTNLSAYLNDYDKWLEEYLRLETTEGIRKYAVSPRELLKGLVTEGFETGRYYPLFLDNANRGPLKAPIKMSNLCSEILLPVEPLESLDDPEGEIALCILSNSNMGRVKHLSELKRIAELLVRGLDNIIDIQEYPLPATRNSATNGRYLGIGVSDGAHYLSKHKVKYDTTEAQDLYEEYMETWQYYLLKASCNLAKERGRAPWFDERSKYADGWLPNDGNQRFVSKELWEQLRADIMRYGLRNLTLSAIPPAGTSSDVSNSTSGVDMPRDFLVTKTSKSGPVKQIVPNFSKGSSYYTLASELDNFKYLTLVSKLQLYTDQSISTNTYLSERDFVDGKMPISLLIKILRHAHSEGLKSLYYMNFLEDTGDIVQEDCEGGGCSV